MQPSAVFDLLSERPDVQRRYRESLEFREFIDALDLCMREAQEQLTTDEYALFVQELIRTAKAEVARLL